jgi:aldose 1-epimerase
LVKVQITGIARPFAAIMHIMNNLIKISHGPFTARLLPMGATLNRFTYHDRDLILGFEQPDDHLTVPIYAGAIVGPIANRIAHGQVKIGQKLHTMQRNENGETTLHSGDDGLHARIWSVKSQQSDRVVFQCDLPKGACGLPGQRRITTEYLLNDTGLQLTITAKSDATTPMNIAHHPYWVLDQDQAETTLEIAAQHYLPTDARGLPTGVVQPVAETQFDYRVTKPIGPSSTLDHNFCLAQSRHHDPRFAARLIASDGLTLVIETTEPGLQVYAGSGLPDLVENITFGAKSHPNAAIALEPQGWPDAPNNTDFPSIFMQIDDVYRQVTCYRISQQS